MLRQLAQDNYLPHSLLFQTLRSMNRLVSHHYSIRCISSLLCGESKMGGEKEWTVAFVTPLTVFHQLFPMNILLPRNEVLMNTILENKALLLFLLLKVDNNIRISLVNRLLSHWKWQEYKADLWMQYILSICLVDERIEKRLIEEFSQTKSQ